MNVSIIKFKKKSDNFMNDGRKKSKLIHLDGETVRQVEKSIDMSYTFLKKGSNQSRPSELMTEKLRNETRRSLQTASKTSQHSKLIQDKLQLKSPLNPIRVMDESLSSIKDYEIPVT